MALIDAVAAKGRAITLVGDEADETFRHLVAFWKHPENKPVALVAKDVRIMHIKAVVADRKCGYLGSGNLTMGGFKNNLELGVEFDGKLAEEIWAFVENQQKARLLVELADT
jgi:phosphatidylserine/phosphatidylglycerophosphate/cardiolipin synthase-like enzyme